jgi:Ni/Co efflux regulator RcnB
MRSIPLLARLLVHTMFISAACATVAQGPPGHDRDDRAHGHEGVPPGQAKKHDDGDREHGGDRDHDRRMPPGQAKKYGDHDRDLPPGQARKHDDFRFHDQDRGRFYEHYRSDADHWRGHRRPVFVPGQYIPGEYVVRYVPRSYWVGVVAAPPPGYRYGYAGGYVVAYNPTTRMIADVIDLIGTAATR